MSAELTAAGHWFRRVTTLGIVANLGLAVPTVLVTQRMLELTGLPNVEPLMWTQFSALLLIILSAFYVPAAIDPNRYRVVAWLAVASRLTGVTFFLVFQAPEYRMFGYFDGVFFIPELALLLAMNSAKAGHPRIVATGPAAAGRPR